MINTPFFLFRTLILVYEFMTSPTGSLIYQLQSHNYNYTIYLNFNTSPPRWRKSHHNFESFVNNNGELVDFFFSWFPALLGKL